MHPAAVFFFSQLEEGGTSVAQTPSLALTFSFGRLDGSAHLEFMLTSSCGHLPFLLARCESAVFYASLLQLLLSSLLELFQLDDLSLYNPCYNMIEHRTSRLSFSNGVLRVVFVFLRFPSSLPVSRSFFWRVFNPREIFFLKVFVDCPFHRVGGITIPPGPFAWRPRLLDWRFQLSYFRQQNSLLAAIFSFPSCRRTHFSIFFFSLKHFLSSLSKAAIPFLV